MKLAILGATGATGRALVEQALEAGHEVVALARRADAIAPRAHLAVVSGSIADDKALDRVIAGSDAVLSALGGRPWRRRASVCATATQHVLPLMARHGVRRIVAISTFGAGDTRPHVGWLARHLLFGLVLRSEVADKEAMEDALARSGLDWTVVRVGLLTDEPPSGACRAADDESIRGMGKVARADVAAFMLQQLDSGAWMRRRPVLMGPMRAER